MGSLMSVQIDVHEYLDTLNRKEGVFIVQLLKLTRKNCLPIVKIPAFKKKNKKTSQFNEDDQGSML